MDANEDIQLLMTYMSSIDGAGHKFGPDSREVNEALKDVDRAVGQLIKELRGRNLENLVDLVIVSDHGLANQPDEKTIYLDDYIPDFESLVDWVDYGPVTSIVPSSKGEAHSTLLRSIRCNRAVSEIKGRCFGKESSRRSLFERGHS